MSFYQGLQAEMVPFRGHNGDQGEAYYARPTRAGKFPGVVVIHHIPGWCEWTTEVVRKLAHHGYAAISPHLYFREGIPARRPTISARASAPPAASPTRRSWAMSRAPWPICARSRMPPARSASSASAPAAATPISPPARCPASTPRSIAGAAMSSSTIPKQLNAKRPVAPIDLTEKMTCPLLGIFGNDDANPTADQVNRTEAVLKKLGKNYEFHRYDGAGHAFFNTLRDAYRPEQAIDGWRKVFDFFNRNLAASASSIAAE